MSGSVDSDETRLDDAQLAAGCKYRGFEDSQDDCVNILTNNDDYDRASEAWKSRQYFETLKRKQVKEGARFSSTSSSSSSESGMEPPKKKALPPMVSVPFVLGVEEKENEEPANDENEELNNNDNTQVSKVARWPPVPRRCVHAQKVE